MSVLSDLTGIKVDKVVDIKQVESTSSVYAIVVRGKDIYQVGFSNHEELDHAREFGRVNLLKYLMYRQLVDNN